MVSTVRPPHAAAPFRGFGPGVLSFFEELAVHQTREWFLDHKATFDNDIREPLGALVEALAFAFAANEIPLTGDAKRSVFRINRDVRFSKDKSPYKTNSGASMTRDGEKMAPGMLYIQIGGEPGSMTAAGFYGPEPKDLAALRQAIVKSPAGWRGLVDALAGEGLAFSMTNALARPPKGVAAPDDPVAAEALKFRNFVVSRPIAAERLRDAELVDDIVAFTRAALPLLRFGWSAIDRARAAG